MYAYLLKLTGDRDTAEELTQDAFFKIFRRIGEYRGECRFYTWACSIARNGYLDQLRRKKKHVDIPFDEIALLDPVSIQETVEAKEMSRLIHEKLESLDEPYRQVFKQRAFEELSFSTIARLHGKTESWARVTYHRARLMIKETIE